MLTRPYPGIPPAGACIPLHTGPFHSQPGSCPGLWYVTGRGAYTGRQAGGHEGRLKSFHADTRYDLFPIENLSGQLPLRGQRIRISPATFKYGSITSEKAPDLLFYFPKKMARCQVLSPISEAPRGFTCLIKHRDWLISAGQRPLIFSVPSEGRGKDRARWIPQTRGEGSWPQLLPSLGPEPHHLKEGGFDSFGKAYLLL